MMRCASILKEKGLLSQKLADAAAIDAASAASASAAAAALAAAANAAASGAGASSDAGAAGAQADLQHIQLVAVIDEAHEALGRAIGEADVILGEEPQA